MIAFIITISRIRAGSKNSFGLPSTQAITKEIIAAIKAVHKNKLSYALVAPAFMGQFDKNVTPGMLRNALKKLGFTGMVEVSLFADILTLKEALELNKNIKSDTDFMLTSCC